MGERATWQGATVSSVIAIPLICVATLALILHLVCQLRGDEGFRHGSSLLCVVHASLRSMWGHDSLYPA
jgi:hypothetical protein